MNGLTEKQGAFVDYYVSNGGIGSDAAVAAGYAGGAQEAWRLVRNPAIAAAIREAQSREIQGLACLALGVLRAVLEDTDASRRDKIAAGRTVLEAAQHLGRRRDPERADQPLAEMSAAQLGAFIDAERVALAALEAGLGKTIEGEYVGELAAPLMIEGRSELIALPR